MAIFVLICAVSRNVENRWRARLASVLLDKLVPSFSSFDSTSRMVNGYKGMNNYECLVNIFALLHWTHTVHNMFLTNNLT
jgi:hypothetical protein